MYYMDARKKERRLETLPCAGSERSRQVAEPQHTQAGGANQGGTHTRYPAERPRGLGCREEKPYDAFRMDGKIHGRGCLPYPGKHEVEAERAGKGGTIPIIYRET